MTDPSFQERVKALQADVSAQRVARVYAEAMLNTSAEKGKEQNVVDAFDQLIQLHLNPDVAAFFLSGTIGRNQRRETIQSVFEGRLDPLMVDFLHVLNDHERLDLVRVIADQFHELLDERKGIGRVYVHTAVPMPSLQQEKLTALLTQGMVLRPVLEFKVDPKLLGGLIIKSGDWMFDASVSSRINTIRKYLTEESSHEIQSGRNRFSTSV